MEEEPQFIYSSLDGFLGLADDEYSYIFAGETCFHISWIKLRECLLPLLHSDNIACFYMGHVRRA
jgi:hypothetical protein